MIAVAEKRLASIENALLRVADAYTLEGVSGTFTAAYAHWWWSHVPKSKLEPFISRLHEKLAPGALVLFVDQLSYDWKRRRLDREGNLIEERVLKSGRIFEIVKNFPTEREIVETLSGVARGIVYESDFGKGIWFVSYTTREGD
jgi:demethylmenaquinone methyltransferase/2-methoxy-6-polyprenyl-1,4-benzoquinol methylase